MKKLNSFLEEWHITLSEKQIRQFATYFDLLTEWNAVMNLTAITERDEVILKHFADSLALLHYMDLQDQTVLDLGTGAGFPGIPLKIAIPTLKVTLMDSQQKRLRFLDTVVRELKLTDVETVHGRAEDLAHQVSMREQFDLCTSRAVANLATLSEYALPFVKTGGYFVPYKSEKTDVELQDALYAIDLLGGGVENVYSYHLPGSDLMRTLLLIKKEKGTPKKYPRKAGVPSKEPITKK